MSQTLVPEQVPIQPYGKTELAGMYGITRHSLNSWTEEIPEFGVYKGKRYTIRQIELIFDHCGRPLKKLRP